MRLSTIAKLSVAAYISGFLWGFFFFFAGVLRGNPTDEWNVNTKYVVETVEFSGAKEDKLSRPLREDIQRRIGARFDPEAFRQLALRIRDELKARAVNSRLVRGSSPEQVKVVFEVRKHEFQVDTSSSRFAYHSSEGWTGDLQLRGHGLGFGVLSDGDRLLERYAGIEAGFHRRFAGRFYGGFQFGTYHQQWNWRTQSALAGRPDVPGIYRERMHFNPNITVELARPLQLSVAVDAQLVQTQFPAARTEAANAVTNTLRFKQSWEDSVTGEHTLILEQQLRAATKVLSSDYVYARHLVSAGYRFRRNRHTLEARGFGGLVTGRAPLFERFAPGNTTSLRGWNKYDLAPIGGNRVAHGSMEYRYRIPHTGHAGVFYDTGAVWDDGKDPKVRHSVGFGFGSREGFYLCLAFPLNDGRGIPVFMIGVNF